MTEQLRKKCELLAANRSAVSKKFKFENELMSIAAGLIFTLADKEADVEKLMECRAILKQHTGFFSEYRETVKLALLSEMALSDDAEQYIEHVKSVYKKLHKGHFKDNSYMVLAAMLLCDLEKQSNTDEVIDKHNVLMERMNQLHPVLTDSSDISFVILLALSDRTTDAIIEDMEFCLEYLKKTCKLRIGSDSIQGLSEILALTDGDIREKCDAVIRLYELLKENKAEIGEGSVFSSLALLTNIHEEPASIVSEVLEADAFLKDSKIYGDKSEDKKHRLMFAELLVASSYGTGASIVNNAFINSAFGIITANRIAAIISVMSNVLPAIIGAAADTETSNEESSQ